MSKPNNFKPALLVVDVQNDFCPPTGSLAVPDGRSIISHINTLISLPNFAWRIATKDFHPQSHISFASNHSAPNNVAFTSFAKIVNPYNSSESYETRLWPDHCVQGSPGADLVDGLDPLVLINEVIEKGKDDRVEMYSAFYDPFTSPRVSDSGISASLKTKGITWTYIAGLALDYCVRATALDARKEGFEVVVVTEATKAVDPSKENIEKVYSELRAEGIRIVSMDDAEVEYWLKL